jgi:hypothetical protein
MDESEAKERESGERVAESSIRASLTSNPVVEVPPVISLPPPLIMAVTEDFTEAIEQILKHQEWCPPQDVVACMSKSLALSDWKLLSLLLPHIPSNELFELLSQGIKEQRSEVLSLLRRELDSSKALYESLLQHATGNTVGRDHPALRFLLSSPNDLQKRVLDDCLVSLCMTENFAKVDQLLDAGAKLPTTNMF